MLVVASAISGSEERKAFIKDNGDTKGLLAAVTVAVLLFGSTAVNAVVYTWTGAVDGDWNNAANWDANGVPVEFEPGREGLSFENSNPERIVINAINHSPTTNVPMLNPGHGAATPTVDVLNGHVAFVIGSALPGDGHTLLKDHTFTTIGDGDESNGFASLTYTNPGQFRREGNFTMAVTVNRDATLNFNRTGRVSSTTVSRDSNKNLHVTLAGGSVNFSGTVRMVRSTDTGKGNSWFDFTEMGATFTASFGNYFANLAAVEAIIEDGFTFRSSEGLTLAVHAIDEHRFEVFIPPPFAPMITMK